MARAVEAGAPARAADPPLLCESWYFFLSSSSKNLDATCRPPVGGAGTSRHRRPVAVTGSDGPTAIHASPKPA
eukprot:5445130-Prymnesium_polylepis.1